MQLPDETYRSFTPYRQEGVSKHPDYYARNGYWKPPNFNKGEIWIHEPTGVRLKRLTDPSMLEHLSAGGDTRIYYVRLPSSADGDNAREELVSGPILVKRIGPSPITAVFTVTDFFLDGPRRKTGYVRVAQ